MNNLYNKIYNAVNEGIQKALLIDPDQNDVSVNYAYHKINNWSNPLLMEFVDLELPSGTLWCEHNLGATCEDNDASSWFGNYYTYKEMHINSKYNIVQQIYKNKYNNSNITKKVNIPTKEQVNELFNLTIPECVINYNGINGLNGMTFTGGNGKILFIPAAGYINNSGFKEVGSEAQIWSKSFDDDGKSPWSFGFDSNDIFYGGSSRNFSLSVRAVCF